MGSGRMFVEQAMLNSSMNTNTSLYGELTTQSTQTSVGKDLRVKTSCSSFILQLCLAQESLISGIICTTWASTPSQTCVHAVLLFSIATVSDSFLRSHSDQLCVQHSYNIVKGFDVWPGTCWFNLVEDCVTDTKWCQHVPANTLLCLIVLNWPGR